MRKAKISKEKLIIVLVLLVLILAFSIEGLKLIKLRQEEKALKERNELLTAMRDELLLKYDSVQSKEYIENQARGRLKLVRPEEIIYIYENNKIVENNGENTN